MKTENIYTGFNFSSKYKKKLIDFLKNLTTVETGGYKMFDGTYDHMLQIPDELANLVILLKKIEKKRKIKFKSFLEIGFSHGITNTLLHKFFNFKKNVAIDTLGPHINGTTLLANLRFKDLILICSRSDSKRTIDFISKLSPFDIIFIDANHEYSSVKKDFNNYKKNLSKNGIVIFHDIALPGSGSKKFWKEIKKSKKYSTKEIICKKYNFQYGIGVASSNDKKR